MAEWNPGEGLKEIEFEDIQVGDTIRTYCNHNGFESCVQHVVTDLAQTYSKYKLYTPGVKEVVHLVSDKPKFYLVERPVQEEPRNLGDVAIIISSNGYGVRHKLEYFIRVRNASDDGKVGDTESWTDMHNNLTVAWEEIIDRLKWYAGNSVLEIHKAKYKKEN